MAGTQDFGAAGIIVRDVKFNPSTGGSLGTLTNDSASTGTVGEYISSYISTAANFPTSNNWGDLTSISLTAGDWDISVVLDTLLNGATVTNIQFGVSTTSGNSGTGLNAGDNLLGILPPTAATDSDSSICGVRASLATTTIHYFKYLAVYSLGTPQARGRISARRVR